MNTASDEGVQNGADNNTDQEDAYQYTPDETNEYAYAYMDVKGQKDTHLTSAAKQAKHLRDRVDAKTENQASAVYIEPVQTESESGQEAYTALILEEVGKEEKEGIPQIYTQLTPVNGEQDRAAEVADTNLDADQCYMNSKVVTNMKKMKGL